MKKLNRKKNKNYIKPVLRLKKISLKVVTDY